MFIGASVRPRNAFFKERDGLVGREVLAGQEVGAQAENVAEQHLQVLRGGYAEPLDVCRFAQQLLHAGRADTVAPALQQRLPRSTRRVTAVEPGEPGGQFGKSAAKAKVDHVHVKLRRLVSRVHALSLLWLTHNYVSRYTTAVPICQSLRGICY